VIVDSWQGSIQHFKMVNTSLKIIHLQWKNVYILGDFSLYLSTIVLQHQIINRVMIANRIWNQHSALFLCILYKIRKGKHIKNSVV
jgi:hypothetical protein